MNRNEDAIMVIGPGPVSESISPAVPLRGGDLVVVMQTREATVVVGVTPDCLW